MCIEIVALEVCMDSSFKMCMAIVALKVCMGIVALSVHGNSGFKSVCG